MTDTIPFSNAQEAYKAIKTGLTKKGYTVEDFEEIQYGIQFLVALGEKKELIRIYKSKRGTSIDCSQIKNPAIRDDVHLSIDSYKNGSDASTTKNGNGKVLSFCVGINNFVDTNFVSLKYAAKDAEELNSLLFEKFGYGEGTLKLVNEAATLRDITDNLIKLKEIAKPEDTLLIFFATHGEFVKSKEETDFYLITYDSGSNNLVGTALPMNILKKLISEIPAEKKVIFLDSCFSGGICRRDTTEISPRAKEEIIRNLESEDFIIITSCLENEKSQEYDTLQHGVFTYYLLSGLTGAVESKNDLIDLYTLYVYVGKYVKGYVEKESKRRQTPRFFGIIKGPVELPKLKELTRPKKSGKLPEYGKMPLDNKTVKLKFETINCIGIDESGKGDYFGPLVVTGVYVDTESKINQLRALGVKDSKRIPDNRIKLMAQRIRNICDREEIFITPAKYNYLYTKMGNLNEILAWAHAQSLERLLERNPDCDIAISDQFAWKEILINKLKEKGKRINLIQRPKAEENIAVAAASVLARAKFIQKLEDMEKVHKQKFSKGANDQVIKDAVNFLKNGGNLEEIAKRHFKTTDKVRELYDKH